jgi:hypothetical protein
MTQRLRRFLPLLLFPLIVVAHLAATYRVMLAAAGLSDGAFTIWSLLAQLAWLALAFPLGLIAAMLAFVGYGSNLSAIPFHPALIFLPNAILWAAIICWAVYLYEAEHQGRP